LASAWEFTKPLLVIGNDLNFTLSHREIWGESLKFDTQRGFFLSLLSKHHLVDLESLKLVPTWQNHHIGREVVTKRMDTFLALETLVGKWMLVHSSVYEGGISDNWPIIL
jgi:hypothetical protein